MTKKISDSYAWLGISIQFMQAISYLHDDVKLLHNDIMSSNILLTDSSTESPKKVKFIQIFLIDFGKAAPIETDRKCHLADSEKAEYAKKYPHIAPEVVNGLTSWTISSDMHSAGRIMQRIIDQLCFDYWKNYFKKLSQNATVCNILRDHRQRVFLNHFKNLCLTNPQYVRNLQSALYIGNSDAIIIYRMDLGEATNKFSLMLGITSNTKAHFLAIGMKLHGDEG